MPKETNGNLQDYLRGSLIFDIRASLVVFLVALPLCMGIAIASGIPADKAAGVGIITGIVGGLVVGFFGGSPMQVSGPAAGLSVLVLGFITTHGFPQLGAVILVAGAIQLIAGLLRMGQVFRAVSPAVIQGMLAGIGILIIASQFHVMLDHKIPGKTGLENLLGFPKSVVDSFGENRTHIMSARIGITTILVMLLWGLFAPKKLRFLPAPLVGIVVATAEMLFMEWSTAGLNIRKVTVPANLLEAVHLPTWENVLKFQEWDMWVAAISIAVIASAETLLCAAAVDKLQTGSRTKYDRELAAQGVGNMICGFLGVLPMTGVIVRSAANVDAGAKTRMSAVFHGFWLLIFVSVLAFLLAWIPIAGLAAILVLTGYKLVNPKGLYELWKVGKDEFIICIITIGFIVAEDLLIGVMIGVGLSIAKLVYKISRLTIRIETDADQKRTSMYLRGTASFLRLPRFAAALEAVPPDSELHVHLEELNYIDHACFELLINWEKQHHATGGTLVIDWDTLHARFDRQHRQRSPEDSTNPPPDVGDDKTDRPETPVGYVMEETVPDQAVPEEEPSVKEG